MRVSLLLTGLVRVAPIPWICGLALLAAGCGRKTAPAFERPPAPVESAAAIVRDVPLYIDAVGKIAAREVVTIQPQVSGRITEIHFPDGAEVKAGQTLFTIDPRPFQAQLKAAEANLAQAKANLEMANINLSRMDSVSDARAVSRQDYDVKKNAVQVADAQVKQFQAALDSARLNLDYTTITTSIGGRAGQRMVDVGNVVNANATALLVIQRMDPVYADFTVTEHDLSTVQRHLARGGLTVEVRLPEDPGEPRAGKLERGVRRVVVQRLHLEPEPVAVATAAAVPKNFWTRKSTIAARLLLLGWLSWPDSCALYLCLEPSGTSPTQ
jgi:multidrug efflux system membrane fusion protein